MFDLIRQDYERHGRRLFSAGFLVLLVYRYGVWSARRITLQPFRWCASKLYGFLLHIGILLTRCCVYREVRIGSGLHLIHPWNIAFHPDVVIGDHCGVMHDVLIGTTPQGKGVPVIGDDVFIGRGATILGPITIGDHARVAANSLVISDVPAYATAIGVPAKIIRNPVPAAVAEDEEC